MWWVAHQLGKVEPAPGMLACPARKAAADAASMPDVAANNVLVGPAADIFRNARRFMFFFCGS
jgi:hypothetical protein